MYFGYKCPQNVFCLRYMFHFGQPVQDILIVIQKFFMGNKAVGCQNPFLEKQSSTFLYGSPHFFDQNGALFCLDRVNECSGSFVVAFSIFLSATGTKAFIDLVIITGQIGFLNSGQFRAKFKNHGLFHDIFPAIRMGIKFHQVGDFVVVFTHLKSDKALAVFVLKQSPIAALVF